MQEVGVDRKRRLAAFVLGDRDLVLLREGEERAPGGEAPLAPRRDDLDVGLEGIGRELEAHLVVALAGRAVGDRVRPDLAGDVDEMFGDQGPSDRGAEQILTLVLGVGAEHREHVVADELLAYVLDVNVLGFDAEELGLPARRLELFALAEIGGEGDDLGAIFSLQPFEDDRCVQPARIGENDAFDLRLLRARHGGSHQEEEASWGHDGERSAGLIEARVVRATRSGHMNTTNRNGASLSPAFRPQGRARR